VKTELKRQAIELRKKGYSLQEIVDVLGVSKSTASTWVRNVPLSKKFELRLLTKIKVGQLHSQKAHRLQRIAKEVSAKERAEVILKEIPKNKYVSRFVCALLYFCEGRKSIYRGVDFTNSDLDLMKLFMKSIRESFILDESRFRVQVHLHSYHDTETQLNIWSKATGIPRNQFTKPYHKKTSGMYKKEGYAGCACVSYHDVTVSRELRILAYEYMKSG